MPGDAVGVEAAQAPASAHNGALQTCSVRRRSEGAGFEASSAAIEAAPLEAREPYERTELPIARWKQGWPCCTTVPAVGIGEGWEVQGSVSSSMR